MIITNKLFINYIERDIKEVYDKIKDIDKKTYDNEEARDVWSLARDSVLILDELLDGIDSSKDSLQQDRI